jgi:hypothetical protein
MKTKFLLFAGLLSALSLVQAQDMSGQQDAQPVSASTGASPGTSTSASPGTSTSPSPGTSGYGGVSGGTSATGNLSRSGWATCGHLPQCNADSGH